MYNTIQRMIKNLIIWFDSKSEVINNFARGMVAGNMIVSNGGGVYARIEI